MTHLQGFWEPYVNINALVESLGLDNPFTPFTRSGFYSPRGLQVAIAVHRSNLQLYAMLEV